MSATDAKAWRRSVMSDEEARNFREQYDDCWSTGAVLDEFVRRLGKMKQVCSVTTSDGWYSAPTDHALHGENCRPAVLFVQPEKAKPLSDAEKIERALALLNTGDLECRSKLIAILRGESK